MMFSTQGAHRAHNSFGKSDHLTTKQSQLTDVVLFICYHLHVGMFPQKAAILVIAIKN